MLGVCKARSLPWLCCSASLCTHRWAACIRIRADLRLDASSLLCTRPGCSAAVWSCTRSSAPRGAEAPERRARPGERASRAREPVVREIARHRLDARDRYTAGHSAAVAIYARDIAERLGLSEESQQLAHVCGLVHDVGKIGLTAGLLEKPGPLTLAERRAMEEHSENGERILAEVEDFKRDCHNRSPPPRALGRQGYPDTCAAEEIPLISRIIAAADAYNAMTSDRPVPRRDAESRGSHASGAGCRDPVRHRGRRRVRSRAWQAERTTGWRRARTSRSWSRTDTRASAAEPAGESVLGAA